MSKDNNNNNQTTRQPESGRAERILLSHIFFEGEKIYEEYVDRNMEHQQFQKDVVSHLEFLQQLCRAGLEENDVQRLNGVINFCESFLIRNHLRDIEEQEIETTDQGGTDETIE